MSSRGESKSVAKSISGVLGLPRNDQVPSLPSTPVCKAPALIDGAGWLSDAGRMSSPDAVPWNNRTISGKSRRNSEDDDCAPRHREPFEKPGWSWYEIFMQISTIAFVVVDARERSRKADELRKNGVEDFKAYLSERPADLAALTSAVLLDLNDAAVAMFGGTDKSEFIGSPTHRFFDPLCPVLKNVSAAYFDGKHEYHEQARSIRLDGSGFDTIFAAVMRVPNGPHGVWLAAFIDITEELKRRAALDGLKEELAHFSRISMLGEMSASVAHELGQPLSSISISAMAATRFLEREVPDVAAALDAITRISSQAGRARDVMDRIRGMAAHRVTNAVTVPVVDLVRESMQFIRHELERGKITWSVDIPDLQKHIQVDPIQIQQVLVNLLLNAVQILKDSQTRRPAIQVAGHHHSDCYVLEIKDNGPGLPAESLSRIFDSFYTSRPEGLGLGLSICKTLVEAHGGTIVGLNRTDQPGAIFRVTLPVLPTAHHRSEDLTA